MSWYELRQMDAVPDLIWEQIYSKFYKNSEWMRDFDKYWNILKDSKLQKK